MYGIVNKAIEDLVVEQFGEYAWERVKQCSGVEVAYFISNNPYNDENTYRLGQAIAAEMDMLLADVLIALGEYWILKTGKEKCLQPKYKFKYCNTAIPAPIMKSLK